MVKSFYYIFFSIVLLNYFTPAQTVNKVLISGWGGQHDADVLSAFYIGYTSYDSTQYQGEVLVYQLNWLCPPVVIVLFKHIRAMF